jgi:dihydropteroate synthase
MEPSTPLETLCRIVLRAREYEAQVPSNYGDDEEPDNVDDTGEETLSVLDDDINTSVEEELRGILDDLADDQIAEVLAFCWVGQGTYEASDWDEALEAAAEENNQIDELLEMPMMASVLEQGLAAFDLSCDGIGDLT